MKAQKSKVSGLSLPLMYLSIALVAVIATIGRDVIARGELMGNAAYLIVGASLAGAFGVGGVLHMLLRGGRLPSAILFAFSALPWLTGLAALRSYMGSRAENFAGAADAALHALGGGLLHLSFGALVSGALFAASSHGLAVAAHGEGPIRTTERSAELATAAALAALLSVFALGVAVRAETEVDTIGAVLFPPDLSLVVASFERTASELRVVRLVWLGALAAVCLLIIALGRLALNHRLGRARLVSGAVIVAVALLVLGADYYVRDQTFSSVDRETRPPWGAVPGYEPMIFQEAVDARMGRPPRLIADARGICGPRGELISHTEAVALAEAAHGEDQERFAAGQRRRAETEAMRDRDLAEDGVLDGLYDLLSPLRVATGAANVAGCELPEAATGLPVAVDARADSAMLHELMALAKETGHGWLTLVGDAPMTVDPDLGRELPIARDYVAHRLRGIDVHWPRAGCAPEQGEWPVLAGRLGSAAPSELTMYDSLSEVRLDEGAPPILFGHRPARNRSAAVVLALSDEATAASFVATARRLAELRVSVMYFVLIDELPEPPLQPWRAPEPAPKPPEVTSPQ